MNVFLVDGTYELFRHFYAVPSSKDVEGQEVGAVRGVVGSVLGMLEDNVTHIGVATDQVVESFRNQLWSGYKTGEGIEPALHAQFPVLEEALGALGVCVWPMTDLEADDGLASAAMTASRDASVEQVFICTPDKDLAQCVDGRRVVCLDRRRERLLDEAGVIEKFGVSPASIPDWLALVGDAADGLPGVPRWGAKSSARVLAHYRHLEEIPEHLERWAIKVRGARGLAAQLAEHRSAALLYRRLATLRRDVPLEEPLEALRWRGARRDDLERLCAVTGDRRLLEQMPAWL